MEQKIKIKTGTPSQLPFEGREASAYGLTLPPLEKKDLITLTERVFLHSQAVQFSTGTPVQFSTGINREIHNALH